MRMGEGERGIRGFVDRGLGLEEREEKRRERERGGRTEWRAYILVYMVMILGLSDAVNGFVFRMVDCAWVKSIFNL